MEVKSFFIDIFCLCAFRAITDPAERFKMTAARFHNIAVIDMDYWILWTPFPDLQQIRFQCSFRSAFKQMPGKPVYDIDFFGRLLQLVCQPSRRHSVFMHPVLKS